MKTLKTGIILLILSFSFLTSFGQAEIFGKWNAACYLERNQTGGMEVCAICPISLEKDNLKIADFEVEITNQNLKITIDGKTTQVPYTWNSKLDVISFEYEKSTFAFQVLRGTSTANIILKDNTCRGALLLTKL